jgi:protein arginine kinase
LLEDDPEMVFDQVGRAYGTLRHAYIIASKEALNLLSLLRLGAELKFFPSDTVRACDSLLMEIQPAHLQLHAGKKLTPEQRDAIRAEIIRTRLHSLDPPVISEKQPDQEWEEPPDNIVDL